MSNAQRQSIMMPRVRSAVREYAMVQQRVIRAQVHADGLVPRRCRAA